MELPEKVVLQSKRSIPYQKITVLDCPSNFQEKPSEAALREYAQNYIDTTDLTEPEIDIKIDFLQLWNTPGYEDIVEAERVSLCDTVHVFISKLGIEVSSKVTETEYDTLLERYNSCLLYTSADSNPDCSDDGMECHCIVPVSAADWHSDPDEHGMECDQDGHFDCPFCDSVHGFFYLDCHQQQDLRCGKWHQIGGFFRLECHEIHSIVPQ